MQRYSPLLLSRSTGLSSSCWVSGMRFLAYSSSRHLGRGAHVLPTVAIHPNNLELGRWHVLLGDVELSIDGVKRVSLSSRSSRGVEEYICQTAGCNRAARQVFRKGYLFKGGQEGIDCSVSTTRRAWDGCTPSKARALPTSPRL